MHNGLTCKYIKEYSFKPFNMYYMSVTTLGFAFMFT